MKNLKEQNDIQTGTQSHQEEIEYLKELAKRKDKELEGVIGAAADAVGKFICNPEFTILYYTEGLASLVGTTRGRIEKKKGLTAVGTSTLTTMNMSWKRPPKR